MKRYGHYQLPTQFTATHSGSAVVAGIVGGVNAGMVNDVSGL